MKTPLPLLFVSLLAIACTTEGRVEKAKEDKETELAKDEQEVWAMQDRRIKPGSFAPNITLPMLFKNKKFKDKAGRRHVLLFWASWCSDCKDETPGIKELQDIYPELQWITVSLDTETTKARSYIRENNIRGEHLFDGRGWKGEACTDYAVPLHGIPYLIIIDSFGRIEWTGGKASELKEFLDHHSETSSDLTL